MFPYTREYLLVATIVIIYSVVVSLVSEKFVIADGANWIVNDCDGSAGFSSESGASMPTGHVLSRNQAACAILTLYKM